MALNPSPNDGAGGAAAPEAHGGQRMPDDALRGLQAVVDAVPEAVLVMDPGGVLRMTNQAADRLFADRPVADRADLLSRFESTAVSRPATGGETRGDEVVLRQLHRPNRWFTLRTVALDTAPSVRSDDHPAAERPVAFVLCDITDSRDLRPVREAFLGLVSHELRTPITTIYAGSSVLARQPGLSPPATRMLAQDVSAEAARLYDIVEDLLVLARIERGVLDPLDENVNVDRVIASTIRLAAQRHAAARIRRRGGEANALARGDATYVDQACRNLVLAAIRRPGQAEAAEIEIDAIVDRPTGEVRVVVTDNGPAVEAAELSAAFDLPEPANATNQPVGGLGLFVTRQVVEAMGGRAWASNRLEGGLELGFALRLSAPR